MSYLLYGKAPVELAFSYCPSPVLDDATQARCFSVLDLGRCAYKYIELLMLQRGMISLSRLAGYVAPLEFGLSPYPPASGPHGGDQSCR